MILVVAGTKDGRDIVTTLTAAGYQVMVSVFSEYGRDLLAKANVPVHTGPLDTAGLEAFILNHAIKLVVDASHPYAVNISQNAMQACQTAGIHYLRYERLAAILPTYEKLHVVTDYAAAGQTAAALGKVIFLTTGSRHLKVFKTEPCLHGHRLIARILPEPSVLAECLSLGFMPKDIVALQGPFSHELNLALFKEYHAEVIVTKNGGQVGGCDTKITAAMALDLPLVVIDKPRIAYSQVVDTLEDLIQFVKEVHS